VVLENGQTFHKLGTYTILGNSASATRDSSRWWPALWRRGDLNFSSLRQGFGGGLALFLAGKVVTTLALTALSMT
jgi:hypothetical protein